MRTRFVLAEAIGAGLIGSATPGSYVSVELKMRSPVGRPVHTWLARRRADQKGQFRIRLPHSTLGAPVTAFPTLGPYQLRTDQGVVRFDVTEASVRDGGRRFLRH